ncbi:MAG: FTR1 family protein [Methylobacteriaceae bacterium]|nr:FTR1 family protein [Methylobacteriaceae bacterium]
MIGALIIVFREVLEAGLVVGIVLAATKGLAHRGLWVGFGVVGGTLGSAIVALFAGQLSALFEGTGQELFNAAILAVAVVMLAWHLSWMASHGRELTAELKSVGREVAAGRRPLTALAVVVGVAVLREGAEVVLFLYGILAAGGTTAASVALGGLLGIAAGAGVSAAIYFGLTAIPVRHLFRLTTVLIALLAAGLAAQCVGILQSAGYMQSLSTPLWNTSGILAEDSIAGRILHTLIGYTDQPSGLQLLVYLGIIALIVALTRWSSYQAAQPRPRHP